MSLRRDHADGIRGERPRTARRRRKRTAAAKDRMLAGKPSGKLPEGNGRARAIFYDELADQAAPKGRTIWVVDGAKKR